VEYYVITFPSVYHAFRAKKVLAEIDIAVELIAIPRELSGSCEGLAAHLEENAVKQAVELLHERGIAMTKAGVKVQHLY
jgi:hypothetical protein